MTSFLPISQFWGWNIPIQVGVWRGHSSLWRRFNGFLFVGVSYRKSCGFFYCSTLSQLFPVFTPYSCQWRDCALAELLISLGNIIMLIIICSDVYALYFMFRRLSGRNTQNNSCKNVEQWRNSVISPLSYCEPLWCWWFRIGRSFNFPFLIVIS